MMWLYAKQNQTSRKALRIRTQGSQRKDTPDLLSIAINPSPAGEATQFPLSFYSHTSLTASFSWNNSRFKFILCLIRSRFVLTKSFCWG